MEPPDSLAIWLENSPVPTEDDAHALDIKASCMAKQWKLDIDKVVQACTLKRSSSSKT